MSNRKGIHLWAALMETKLPSQPQGEQLEEELLSGTRKPHGKENRKARFLLLLLNKELKPLLGHENERCSQTFHNMVHAKNRNVSFGVFTSVKMMHSPTPSDWHPTGIDYDLKNYLYDLGLIKRQLAKEVS